MTTYDRQQLAETILRDQAIVAVEKLVAEGLVEEKKLGRTQLKHLQQVARDRPDQVRPYARHQLEKIPTDKHKNHVGVDAKIANFWQVVSGCVETSGNRDAWSLSQQAKTYFPAELNVLDQPLPNGASIEQRQQRNKLNKTKSEFLKDWDDWAVPAFFDFFCIEYLYRLKCRH